MYSPVLCLQSPIPLFAYWFLFGNGSPMCSVHKPVLAGCCRIFVAGIFDGIIV